MTELSLPLSNVQMELLKLYATDLSDQDLKELRTLLGQFYAKRATKLADDIWDKRGLSDSDMNDWLNRKNS